MVHLEDIHSLTDFQRNTKEHIQRLKTTGRPEILTVNGKAEVIIQDAISYQKLLEVLDRLEAIEGIERGLTSMKMGKGRLAKDVIKKLSNKYTLRSAT